MTFFLGEKPAKGGGGLPYYPITYRSYPYYTLWQEFQEWWWVDLDPGSETLDKNHQRCRTFSDTVFDKIASNLKISRMHFDRFCAVRMHCFSKSKWGKERRKCNRIHFGTRESVVDIVCSTPPHPPQIFMTKLYGTRGICKAKTRPWIAMSKVPFWMRIVLMKGATPLNNLAKLRRHSCDGLLPCQNV